jgi:4-amino-4-deoxy-L-arabinose transferase-like glycosyltransferase
VCRLNRTFKMVLFFDSVKNLISTWRSRRIKGVPAIEIFLIVVIAVFTVFTRFWGLGYSHYYGDETKTLYLDKTVPATQWFLNQRKGPVQFLATWFMEKITGGYTEAWIRFPFAVAGTLSVGVFYLLVRKLFGFRYAVVSTILFAFSGFNLAFSRTAQYQAFLIFFTLLSVLFFVYARVYKRRLFLFLSALALVFAALSHYDAFFIIVPLIFFAEASGSKIFKTKQSIVVFVVPIIVLLSLFYIPYYFGGYFEENTMSYLAKRASGEGYLPNSSLNTMLIYNPSGILLLFLLAGIFSYFLRRDRKLLFLYAWALFPFGVLEFLFSNPGTHIHNYMIPLCVLGGFAVITLYKKLTLFWLKYLYTGVIGLLLVLFIGISFWAFLPGFNTGYPWGSSYVFGITVPPPPKKYQLFLYGFPYNRSWDKVSSFMFSQKRVEGVFTNDNDTVAQYYLRGLNYTVPGANFIPQYYIHVEMPQEFFKDPSKDLSTYINTHYALLKEFTQEGKVVMRVYKRLVPEIDL